MFFDLLLLSGVNELARCGMNEWKCGSKSPHTQPIILHLNPHLPNTYTHNESGLDVQLMQMSLHKSAQVVFLQVLLKSIPEFNFMAF